MYKIPISERIKRRQSRSDERFFSAAKVMVFEKNSRYFDIARALRLSPKSMCKIVEEWRDYGYVCRIDRNYRLTKFGYIKLKEMCEEKYGQSPE